MEKISVITVRVTDTNTGLIEYEYIRTYDLRCRFRSERDCLHRHLDDFIDKVRRADETGRRFALEFVNRDVNKELKLDF